MRTYLPHSCYERLFCIASNYGLSFGMDSWNSIPVKLVGGSFYCNMYIQYYAVQYSVTLSFRQPSTNIYRILLPGAVPWERNHLYTGQYAAMVYWEYKNQLRNVERCNYARGRVWRGRWVLVIVLCDKKYDVVFFCGACIASWCLKKTDRFQERITQTCMRTHIASYVYTYNQLGRLCVYVMYDIEDLSYAFS